MQFIQNRMAADNGACHYKNDHSRRRSTASLDRRRCLNRFSVRPRRRLNERTDGARQVMMQYAQAGRIVRS